MPPAALTVDEVMLALRPLHIKVNSDGTHEMSGLQLSPEESKAAL